MLTPTWLPGVPLRIGPNYTMCPPPPPRDRAPNVPSPHWWDSILQYGILNPPPPPPGIDCPTSGSTRFPLRSWDILQGVDQSKHCLQVKEHLRPSLSCFKPVPAWRQIRQPGGGGGDQKAENSICMYFDISMWIWRHVRGGRDWEMEMDRENGNMVKPRWRSNKTTK